MSSPHLKVRNTSRTKRRKASRHGTHVEYRNVDPAVETALYYGFTPLPSPIILTKEDRERAREFSEEDRQEAAVLAPTLAERIALFRYYEEKRLHETPHPIMICSEFLQSIGATSRKKSGERRLFLEIIGSGKSIAEATLIQTAFVTLRKEGSGELSLSINSVGDRESFSRFMRELSNYYRQHLATLPLSCRALLRKSPVELLRCTHEKCKLLAEAAPKTMNFLSDESRKHLREVLEFLEELEIPYRIDHRLLGNRAFATEILFEIWENPAQPPLREAPLGSRDEQGKVRCLCSGVRYNNLGRRLGLRRDSPSIGLNLLLPRAGKEVAVARRVRFRRPVVCFLQLGFCAKLKSLRVIETLRAANIPVHQTLNRDTLISQMSSAEHLKIPYSIILGQREALENSVIVRNTISRAQETVPLGKLADYFKRMKL
ncbi:MAG: hypothetical protein A2849_00050 [Candidatus Taylorbacteria bacterium RIFCSPHIGHO2_01_FULL_51_15]|uniref:Anticodon-binding domain-containing protein n=1 Tax=Candidatus Taylorbacteria bacterium RIFCSPHIGHO2_01_FULL_51_15 TaxID=1802304 RepID=A0A1G2MBR5_9BACT|nr:MAG: hypothetical protein A2849_00050 [Candidatus Taylorbacteria bacterium RIFCSPHIGHO2_01_FULL_51_15]